ncbi:hypothetical protein [Roseibium sp. SCP14]|uniref:hypothetical protein n=1 Tax=Roseibium sp. SCP14 TaxID=3141375 RepID=UPI00333836E3
MANRFVPILAAAALAAAGGFVIHVFTVEWIHEWVAGQMAGKTVQSSWDVRIPAAISSIEIGLALTFCYGLLKYRFPGLRWWIGGLGLGCLMLAVQGRLIRQPLMNWLVGNPVEVVLVQDGIAWLTWLVMALTVAFVVELMPMRHRVATGG